MSKLSLRHYVLAGILGALIAALGFTPLGMIPVPTPAGAATILHIPVILAALLEGPVFGGIVGFMFGGVSFYRAIVAPSNPVAQVMFTEPLTAFLPRILIGLTSFWAFRIAQKKTLRKIISAASGLLIWDLSYRVAYHFEVIPGGLSSYLYFFPMGALTFYVLVNLLSGENAPVVAGALVGSLTNTVGVLGLVTLRGILPLSASAVIAVVQGLPEAAVSILITLLLYKALLRRRSFWRREH